MIDSNLHPEADFSAEASKLADKEQELWPSPGQILKKLREELGYSQEKVSKSIYITVHYVQALENDDYETLPGHTFIKGYYKAYAEFLGTDTEQVLKYCLKYLENFTSENINKVQIVESKVRNKTILWIATTVISIVLLTYVFWMLN